MYCRRLIQSGTDLKEVRRAQAILFLDAQASYDAIKEDGRIETIYFPPYSPEEDPQEHVGKARRSAVTHNTFVPDIEKTA